jgi:hypothetical protein
MCGVCSIGFHVDTLTCVRCTGGTKAMLPVMIIVLGIVAYIVIWVARRFDTRNVVSALQILVAYTQVIGSTGSSYNIPWPASFQNFMANCQFALLDFFQVTSMDCWQRLDFLDTYYMTTGVTFSILILAPFIHRSIPKMLDFFQGSHELELRRKWRNMLIKSVAMYMAILYPAIALKSLSLWNCQQIGDTYYLVLDVSLECAGTRYNRAKIFNILFVLVVVVGWPSFLVWYLQKISAVGKVQDASVSDRIGFLYEPYKQEYIWWDVVETLRKLYLVTIVAFFVSGSMVQIVLSILVSVACIAYHVHALPFVTKGLNVLQAFALSLLWLTFQSGLMLQYSNNEVDQSAATATVVILIIANVMLFISPFMIGLVLLMSALPDDWIDRGMAFLGLQEAKAAPPALASDPDAFAQLRVTHSRTLSLTCTHAHMHIRSNSHAHARVPIRGLFPLSHVSG